MTNDYGSYEGTALRHDGSMGSSAAVEVVACPQCGVHGAHACDPMPEFTFKAKDRLAVPPIEFYRELCAERGLAEQVDHVHEALTEIQEWQLRNPDRMKLPDHAHVPVGRTTSARSRRRYRVADGQLQVWDDSPLVEFGQIWIPVCPGCGNGPLNDGQLVCGDCGAEAAS